MLLSSLSRVKPFSSWKKYTLYRDTYQVGNDMKMIVSGLCEPAAGPMDAFDNVPAENARASSVKPKANLLLPALNEKEYQLRKLGQERLSSHAHSLRLMYVTYEGVSWEIIQKSSITTLQHYVRFCIRGTWNRATFILKEAYAVAALKSKGVTHSSPT